QIKVALDGSAVISLSDDSTKKFEANELVTPSQASMTDPVIPTTKVPVKDRANLSDDDKKK
ncbi:MAG: hypothetical protein Q4B24_05440, partial [Limosilactobacillus ingluviei]|nr:hypothetical protein [Limosilactobacillus ingluviei]